MTYTPVLAGDGADLAAAITTILAVGDADALHDAVEDAFPGSRIAVQGSDYGVVEMRQPASQAAPNIQAILDRQAPSSRENTAKRPRPVGLRIQAGSGLAIGPGVQGIRQLHGIIKIAALVVPPRVKDLNEPLVRA